MEGIGKYAQQKRSGIITLILFYKKLDNCADARCQLLDNSIINLNDGSLRSESQYDAHH